MFIDARKLDPDLTLQTDVCIVGGGAAGIALFLELEGSGLDAVLLESGGLEFDTQVQALNKGQNLSFKPFPIDATRLRGLGGTTQHYGGLSPMFAPSDFQARPGLREVGWPFGIEEIEPYYRRASELCRMGPVFSADAADWQRQVGLPPEQLTQGPVRIAPAPFSPPARFGELYREALGASRQRVLLWATATNLETDPSGQSVERVSAASLSGPPFAVRARWVVLAMGGLETPRLLLLCDDQGPTGLANSSGLVGCHYMDHITLWGGVVRLSERGKEARFLLEQQERNGVRVQGFLRPTEETLSQEPVGNFWTMLTRYPATYEGVAATRELMEALKSARLPGDISSTVIDILANIDVVSETVLRSLAGTNQDLVTKIPRSEDAEGGYASLYLCAEQLPPRDSRVTLSDELDALGQRKLSLDWRCSEADFHTWRRAAELSAAGLAANGLGRARITQDLYDPAPLHLTGISSHHMGTTRMASDPRNGVVDAQCRAHDLSNLFVASSAVFPTGSCANPTLTIVALAIRLADHLKGLPRA